MLVYVERLHPWYSGVLKPRITKFLFSISVPTCLIFTTATVSLVIVLRAGTQNPSWKVFGSIFISSSQSFSIPNNTHWLHSFWSHCNNAPSARCTRHLQSSDVAQKPTTAVAHCMHKSNTNVLTIMYRLCTLLRASPAYI